MNMMPFILLLSLWIPTCSPHGDNPTAQPATIPLASVSPHISIARDTILSFPIRVMPEETYCIFVPDMVLDTSRVTVILFQDPHGDGALPVSMYRDIAKRMGIILVGANHSCNGQIPEENVAHVERIMAQIQSDYGISPTQVTLAGFSGGAKSAMLTAAHNPALTQVLYLGSIAAIDFDHPVRLNGLAATEDMNYAGLVAFHQQSRSRCSLSTQIEYRGKHEWSPPEVYQDLCYAAVLHHINDYTIPNDKKIIDVFSRHVDSCIITARFRKDILTEYAYTDFAIQCLQSLADTISYSKSLHQIATSDAYITAYRLRQVTIERENKDNQALVNALLEKDNTWWSNVTMKLKFSQDPIDKRHLGYISLMCYSYCNQLLHTNHVREAKSILEVYEMADATNTDQLYFHAFYYAHEQDSAKCMWYLQKAIANGFTDIEKIETNPVFEPLKRQTEWAKLLDAIRHPK